MTAAVTARGVVKHYGELAAVNGIDLDIASGEFFGILGPNGAGKTTLLEIIEGVRQPSAGSVEVLGHSSWPRHPELLARIGVQLQSSSFFERLTAREQLRTFASMYGVDAGAADRMLADVGLQDKAATRVEDLSGGQAQRLSIACALVHEPPLVFLDEPTAGLDPQSRRNLWELLRRINIAGRTVVLTTHYMDEAENLCDRVAIMDNGRFLAVGAPAELIRQMDAPKQILIARTAMELAVAEQLPGVTAASDDGSSIVLSTTQPDLVVAALANAAALDGVQIRGANLEDVFLQLTGREYRP